MKRCNSWEFILWGDIGLARNMCKIQPPKPGPTQTPCAPPLRELWVACSATQELPTRLSYAPRTLEQKKQQCWDKKSCAGSAGAKKSVLDTQVTHWHTASRRCQPALLQTDGSTADRQTGKQTHRQARIDGKVPLTSARKPGWLDRKIMVLGKYLCLGV